jgi:hypothetical protein
MVFSFLYLDRNEHKKPYKLVVDFRTPKVVT